MYLSFLPKLKYVSRGGASIVSMLRLLTHMGGELRYDERGNRFPYQLLARPRLVHEKASPWKSCKASACCLMHTDSRSAMSISRPLYKLEASSRHLRLVAAFMHGLRQHTGSIGIIFELARWAGNGPHAFCEFVNITQGARNCT
jgi:hypothetical protein